MVLKVMENGCSSNFPVSEEEFVEFKLMFQALDRNKDGIATAGEFQCFMTKLGYNVTDEKAQKFANALHKSGKNAGVSEQEFIAWMSEFRERNPEAILRDSFRVLDRDGNGYISWDELKAGLELMGQKVSDGAVNMMMRVADKDKDGRLSFKEFVRIMRDGTERSPRK